MKLFTDDDPTTEYRVDWWPANKAIEFPHIFEIDMGGIESFEFTKLGKTGNMNYYPMNSYLQINPGRACISTIEIGHYLNNRKLYHLTNTKCVTLKNRWDETLGGCYYNGKVFTRQ